MQEQKEKKERRRRRIGVMIGSPSDAAEERGKITDTILHWNNRHGHDKAVYLEPVMWEYATPGLEGRPQGMINDQLIPKSDFLIAVFRVRAGTPTGEEISGTIEEIRKFMKAGKYVAVYFYEGEVLLKELDFEQLRMVQDFKKEIQQHGLTGSYSNIDELGGKLSFVLSGIVDHLESQKKRPRATFMAVAVAVVLAMASWILIPKSLPDDPDGWPKKFTTVLLQEALTPEVISSGDEEQERLRNVMRFGGKDLVPGPSPDQHHQWLVSLSDEIGHNYNTYLPMNIAIRQQKGVELGKVLAYLVSYEGRNNRQVSRRMTVHLPEIPNHTGTLELDQPRAKESLLLLLLIGTERDDLDLREKLASDYMLTLTKR